MNAKLKFHQTYTEPNRNDKKFTYIRVELFEAKQLTLRIFI